MDCIARLDTRLGHTFEVEDAQTGEVIFKNRGESESAWPSGRTGGGVFFAWCGTTVLYLHLC